MPRHWAWLALLLVVGAPLHAQRYFGQNQVEYRHLRWQVIETEHFLVHYYPEERVPAMDAARMAERAYTRLSRIIGHQFREKKPIMLFASRADFGSNNVTGDLGEGTGGVTDASRQRIMLPFTGDYGSFERVLTHEMVHQFQYDVFSRGKAGANLQALEQVNPPLWFMEGMAEYLALGPQHTLTSTWIRSAVISGNLPTIKQMTQDPNRFFPYRYGEDFFRYIGQRWGDAAIGEILQSVATGGIDRGFQRELGFTLDQLSDQWREARRAQYLPQLASMQRVRDIAQPLLNAKRSNGALFLAPVLSHDGTMIAFLAQGSEKRGEIFVDLWLGDAATGKRIRRLVESSNNPSFEELRLLYSQGSFSPNDQEFAFTAYRDGRDVLSIVNTRTGHVRQLTDLGLDGIWSPSWSPDGKQIVFSGMVGALTDLYVVNADGTNLRQLTSDRYGDLQPSWSPDGKYIAFSTDRGDTQLSNLTLGKLQIALYNMETNTIDVLPDQSGININPVWSPKGNEIAFLSDRNGSANIYLYDLTSHALSQITNLTGGVNAITEYSPALTWSGANNRMAFTYFENNDYTVWSLDNPEAYKKAPAPPPGTTAEQPTGPVQTRTDTTRTAIAGAQSTYRGAMGARRSGRITGREARLIDSTTVSSVAAALADPNTGLPDTLTFKQYPYSVRFTPDYISGATIGIGTGGGFGTTYGGGTTLVFSDLTGNHQLAVGLGVNGRLSDASFLVGYSNLGRRLQYALTLSQDVAYLNTGAQEVAITNGVRDQYQFTRYVFRTVGATTEYPLNKFTRYEFGAQANSIGRSIVNLNYDYYNGGYYVDVNYEKVQTLSSLNYVSPLAAFVSDNTLFGVTGPIAGRRFRFSASPALGNVRWVDYLADYRRYDPVIFNTLTFSTRLFANVTAGRDEDLFPKYIGRPEFVRGYDRSNFYGGYACDSFLGATNTFGSACATVQLVGTRVAVANEELRFPLIRRFDLGSLPIGLPPVDGLVFYDAGLAWNSGQKISLTKPEGYDYTLQRYVMRSWGFGLRVNLFNLAILKWDYAKPLDRDRKNWNWTFSLGPSF